MDENKIEVLNIAGLDPDDGEIVDNYFVISRKALPRNVKMRGIWLFLDFLPKEVGGMVGGFVFYV